VIRRLHVTRAILGGLGATVAAAAVAAGIAHVDAASVLGDGAPARGWLVLVAAGQAIAFAFAAVWDALPPRTRPVSKAIVFSTALFLGLGLSMRLAPAGLAFAVVLGLAYRPHPAPPVDQGLVISSSNSPKPHGSSSPKTSR
jgi:hypothetical protein